MQPVVHLHLPSPTAPRQSWPGATAAIHLALTLALHSASLCLPLPSLASAATVDTHWWASGLAAAVDSESGCVLLPCLSLV